jgi:hypothetical protein
MRILSILGVESTGSASYPVKEYCEHVNEEPHSTGDREFIDHFRGYYLMSRPKPLGRFS